MVSVETTNLSDWLGAGVAAGELAIRDIHLDSRQVGAGDAFIALAGQRSHGHQYARDAVARGAVAVVADEQAAGIETLGVPVVVLANLKRDLGKLAQRFYVRSSAGLRVLGVTGTNGKTSVSHILAGLLDGLGQRCAVVGTLGWGFLGGARDTGMTTPDVVSIHRILARLAEADANYVAMEVSSHGLDQGRVDAVDFTAAVFTNLSRDHLDYHKDMASYEASKRALFLRSMELAVFNLDDSVGAGFYRDPAVATARLAYSLADSVADVYCRELRYHAGGCDALVVTPWGEGRLQSRLLGPFNLLNVLASITLLGGLGFELKRLLELAGKLPGVPGRMQVVHEGKVRVVVDYAHTPAALEQVLSALRPHVEGKLWVVFGCGGDRDRGKRPLMGAAAAHGADAVVLTSDNPRHEEPQQIIDDVLVAMRDSDKLHCEPDRRRAIEHALATALPGDLVVIAGKGHEDYQEVGGQRRPFSDQRCVEQFFATQNEEGR